MLKSEDVFLMVVVLCDGVETDISSMRRCLSLCLQWLGYKFCHLRLRCNPLLSCCSQQMQKIITKNKMLISPLIDITHHVNILIPALKDNCQSILENDFTTLYFCRAVC